MFSVFKKSDTETQNRQLKEMFFVKTRQQAEALKLVQTDMQCKGEQGGRDGREGDGEGLQTDPFVDFPKHCIL